MREGGQDEDEEDFVAFVPFDFLCHNQERKTKVNYHWEPRDSNYSNGWKEAQLGMGFPDANL